MPQLERASDDDRLMNLVDAALAQPPGEWEAWLRRECGADSQLFDQAREYVESEERMGGFLLEPFCTLELFDPALEPGELLEDRFRIERQVGEGGMAIVYEATDETLNKRIAVKCAKVGFDTRLTPEVRHATEIADDHVCKIFDFHAARTDRGEIDFITMEFLDGPTLTERLRSGPLPEREAREIAMQLCAGLAAAHRKQVIHGDLKSNNVILTKSAGGNLRAVITDFGLARASGAGVPPDDSAPGESDEAVGGARDYMAPELWRGERASVASDIYALGCICYEMLSGARLREPGAPTTQEPRARKPPRVHPKWDRILRRCLDPDRARRYRSVEEIEKALAPRSRRVLLAATAGVVLAAATGYGVWKIATAPKETVRLAVAPLETDGTTASLAPGLLRDTAKQLARIKSNARTRFAVVPVDKATHKLRGKLSQQNGKVILRAHVDNESAHRSGKEWQLEYAPSDLRYAPVALAGIVTAGFRLPPLLTNAAVNSAAAKDYWAGMWYVRRNSTLDKAIASMERAVAEDPASPLTYAGLAEAQWYEYLLTKDQAWLNRSQESLRSAEERNPDLAPVQRVEGHVDNAANSYERAIAEYERAVDLDPRDASSHLWLGWDYQQLNRSDDALAELKKAADLDPQYARTSQAMGAYYLEHSQFELSAEYYKRAVDLAPDEPNLRLNLARSYSNLGHFEEAERQLRSTVKLQETMGALFSLGLTLMYEGKDSEAIPVLARASILNSPADGTPKYAPFMYLGIAHRRLGNLAAALEANRHGLALAEEQVEDPRGGYRLSFVAYFDAAIGDRVHAASEIKQALWLSNIATVRWNAILTYEQMERRDDTLAVVNNCDREQLADVSRWPDLAGLARNERFLELLAVRQTK